MKSLTALLERCKIHPVGFRGSSFDAHLLFELITRKIYFYGRIRDRLLWSDDREDAVIFCIGHYGLMKKSSCEHLREDLREHLFV